MSHFIRKQSPRRVMRRRGLLKSGRWHEGYGRVRAKHTRSTMEAEVLVLCNPARNTARRGFKHSRRLERDIRTEEL